jgi:hypothetical protein
MGILEAGKRDRARKSIASERPGIPADGDGGNDEGRYRALREEPQIRRGRDQNSWRTETGPCDTEPGAPRSATMALRDYGKPGGIPTLIDAPHAGHTAMIADYYEGQSLVQTLLATASAMWR